jgi:hypothetical protein
MTGATSQDRQSCQFLFLLDEKTHCCSGRCGRRGVEMRADWFVMEPLARTQSERLRRLALASGIRLLRSFGINRLDASGSVAGRGIVGPDG